ncbi:MAG: hypothetical protein O2890_14380 [Cyanobacteria bacterium]|nr:hypothetical protein [Cyanobacteriota bacterium]
MKPTLQVWPQERQYSDDTVTVSARLELGTQSHTLWFQVPRAYETALAPNSDAFAVATVLLAMKKASQLIIHGEVSPTLLRNLEEFQAAWASWVPSLAEIPIVAEAERELVLHRQPAAIAAFSGGVDSSYTVFRHGTARLGRRTQPLKAGLFVHGFDIPLDQPDVFDRARQRATAMLSSLDLATVPMATNFRTVMDPRIPWETSFGTAIAARLTLLQGQFDTGLIASSYSYSTLSFPYGSNPVTDPLLGSQGFALIYDGADQRRLGKVQTLMDWPAALEQVRVCWQGAEKDRNCCECEKCIRNILTFRLAGAGLPPCFDQDVTDQQIRSLRLKGGSLDALMSLQEMAQQQGITAAWVKATTTAIHRSQRQIWLKQRLPGWLKP